MTIESRGGETGGATLEDFRRAFEDQGYPTDFQVLDSGHIRCGACEREAEASTFRLKSLRRVEGVSDPADMTAVGAVVCSMCGARGTAEFAYGARSPAGDAQALREIHDERHSHEASQRAEREDHSLVRDTGWLRHDPSE